MTAAEPEQADGTEVSATEGEKLIAIDATVENFGTEPVEFHVEQFQLTDSQGRTHYPAAGPGKEPRLSGANIEPSTSIRGFIGFEIPIDTQPVRLVFTHRLGARGLALWEDPWE